MSSAVVLLLDRMNWMFQSELQTVALCEFGLWCAGDFIAMVSLDGLILHLIAHALSAHSSHILFGDVAWNVGRCFCDIYGIGKYEAWFFRSVI